MIESHHFGLIGGLGVGATVIYYEAIAAACQRHGMAPRITMANAHAPTALALVQGGRADDLADYLARFAGELAAAGATFFAIPAITPHICRDRLKRLVTLPLVDLLDVTAAGLRRRGLARVALFGTRFTIDSAMFGALSGIDVVRPQDAEVDEIHRIYLELATQGRSDGAKERLQLLARTIIEREALQAIVLAGTDLNLVLDETTAGFPAFDCAAAQVTEIVRRMTS